MASGQREPTPVTGRALNLRPSLWSQRKPGASEAFVEALVSLVVSHPVGT